MNVHSPGSLHTDQSQSVNGNTQPTHLQYNQQMENISCVIRSGFVVDGKQKKKKQISDDDCEMAECDMHTRQ